MERIIPAVIPYSSADVPNALSRYAFAPLVQIDLVDGVFASPASWPYNQREEVSFSAQLPPTPAIELDLMVADPLSAARAWQKLGARRFVLHADAFADTATLTHTITTLREMMSGALVGVALSSDTPLSILDEIRDQIDCAQCMGIATVGAQGQPFDARVLARVASIKAAHPTLPLTVDGGVSLETLPKLATAGADRFVVGSAIANAAHPEERYQQLTQNAESV